MSTGVKRLFLAVVVVLLVLAAPMMGADAWGAAMRGWGLPAGWSFFSLIGLVLLALALAVGWVGHRVAFAIFGKKTVASLAEKRSR